jgi:uncharacterized repeat protein (TIGR01451 family)
VITRTYTITDGCGNATPVDQVFTVTDNTLPTITCPLPANIPASVNITDLTNKTYVHSGFLWDATATDGCGGAITLTANLTGATGTLSVSNSLSTTAFKIGTTHVIWTATDACGNSNSCASFDVVVLGTADIKVTKTGSVNPPAGATMLYHIVVENLGPAVAPLITLTDNVPPSILSPVYSLDGVTNWLPWPPASGNLQISNLPVTIYDVYIRGTVDCAATGNIVNTANVVLSTLVDTVATNDASTYTATVSTTPLSQSANITGETCTGSADGAIDLTASGGTTGASGYTYNWTGPGTFTSTSEDLTGLATGTYHATVTDFYGCTSEADYVVGTIPDVTDPTITCPAVSSPVTVNINNLPADMTYVHSGTGWDATGDDNCTKPPTVIATLSGATTVLASANTTTLDGVHFNIGTTTVTWTATDATGNDITCTFNVVVRGTTDLEITKAGAATAIVGAFYEYTLTVKNLGTVAAPVVTISDAVPSWLTSPEYSINGGANWAPWTSPYVLSGSLNAGASRVVLLRGTPDCSAIGTVSNTATVALSPIVDTDLTNNTSTANTTISDGTGPTFTLSSTADINLCVMNIQSAVYNMSPTDPDYDDLTTPRPDYYQFTTGNTVFDHDAATLSSYFDNCCAVSSLVLHWRIDFQAVPAQAPPHTLYTPASISGTGPPSLHADFQLPGDGVNFVPVTHRISYWLEDCAGNPTGPPIEQHRDIVINPRPKLVKVP